MSKYILELSYDGTDYHGWQMQDNARSVQGVITDACEQIFQSEFKLFGCGRTDTGVHASNFIAHFERDQLPTDFKETLNRILPNDIRIEELYCAPEDFHARFSAISRTYLYEISQVKPLFNRNFASWDRREYDVELLNKSCELVVKTTDFGAFCKVKSETKTNDCKIMEAQWIKTDNGLLFKVVANRFLRNMVRAMVGTMLDLGRKKITLTDFENILLSKKRSYAGPSAEAKGLILSKVEYDRTDWKSVC